MEILFDLDAEAKEVCNKLGIPMIRAKTVGLHPVFVSMIRELICERLFEDNEKRYLGSYGPTPDKCSPNCCALS